MFEAKMVLAGAWDMDRRDYSSPFLTLSSYSANSFCLSAMFSDTASSTRSAVWMEESTVVLMFMLDSELGDSQQEVTQVEQPVDELGPGLGVLLELLLGDPLDALGDPGVTLVQHLVQGLLQVVLKVQAV